MTAALAIAERIHRNGPIRFGAFVELALYGPGGFFTRAAAPAAPAATS